MTNMADVARFGVAGLPIIPCERNSRRERYSSARTTTRFNAISWRANAASKAWQSFAHCLTPNHVHLILGPYREEALGEPLRRDRSLTLCARTGTDREGPLRVDSGPSPRPKKWGHGKLRRNNNV